MKKKHHFLIWVAFIFSGFALIRTFCWLPVTRVHEERSPEYAASAHTYLRNALTELTRNGEVVHFDFLNGSYGIMKDITPDPAYPDHAYQVWTGKFDLAVDESFKHRPSHHQSSRYTLKEIEPTGIIIEYEKRFDHRSFGKNLISLDRGELRIPWKQSDAHKELKPANEPVAGKE